MKAIMKIDSFMGWHYFLSNFYPAPVTLNGDVYPTTEHAYQALKTTNVVLREEIRQMPTPVKAKRAGQIVPMRKGWHDIKEGMMESVLREKFSHADLLFRLKSTGDAEIVEGNSWHDQTWGDCTCEKHKDIPGQNLLGKLLMKIRDEKRN